MTTALYLAAVHPRSGKSLIALGVMELLANAVERLGYFRPVASDHDDHRVALMRDRYDLGDRAGHAYTDAEFDHLLAAGKQDEIFKGVISAYHELAERCDAILVEGTDQASTRDALEFDFNARMANNLGASMIVVIRAGDDGHTVEDTAEAVQLTHGALAEEGVSVAATFVNRVKADLVDQVADALSDVPGLVAVIGEDPRLAMPTLREVVVAIGATDVHNPGDADVDVTTFKVAAMTVPNLLDHLEDGELLITPGDRADVLLAALASRVSTTAPNIAGVVLTGGLEPAPQVLRLFDGLGGITVPIYATADDTFTTARAVADVHPRITSASSRKIATALGIFEDRVDTGRLREAFSVVRSDRVTPLMFEHMLVERARTDRRHIVLPEGIDPRILQASALLNRRGVVDLTLLGAVDQVRATASRTGVDLGGLPIIDPTTSEHRERFANAYVEERSHKGMVMDRALEVMTDVSYFGTMMVHLGLADGMVSGAAHTTAHTIRPAFEFIRTRPGVDNVSSVFLMCLADRVLVYGDCAIIPNPTAEQLADIAIASTQTARTFGIDPRVAMLSYSTGESGTGEDVERVRLATKLVAERQPDLPLAGPIQYDAAVDISVGQKKMPGSAVAGRATVFVFPDLNTGNNTYKAVQRSAGAVAIGPVLQGLNKPVNDLSRGCQVPDIVNTVAITAIQAQLAEGRG